MQLVDAAKQMTRGARKRLRKGWQRARIRAAYRFAPRAAWQRWAQPGEYAFHRDDQWRAGPAFEADNARLFRHFGFRPDQFRGGVVIDLGAGSRLRSRFFEGARIVVIEPLLERFREIAWCDLDTAWRCYGTPAEEAIRELAGSADFLMSINVLDHCFDFDRIVRNARAYLKPGGSAFLSFDSHEVTDAMHPLVLTEASARARIEAAGFRVDAHSRGLGPIGPTYGHGEALNFWVSPVGE